MRLMTPTPIFLRRVAVHRVSIVDRSSPLWRTDVDLDSWWGFNAKLSLWSFRVLAEKVILGDCA